jgi:hypothetical protein
VTLPIRRSAAVMSPSISARAATTWRSDPSLSSSGSSREYGGHDFQRSAGRQGHRARPETGVSIAYTGRYMDRRRWRWHDAFGLFSGSQPPRRTPWTPSVVAAEGVFYCRRVLTAPIFGIAKPARRAGVDAEVDSSAKLGGHGGCFLRIRVTLTIGLTGRRCGTTS